ncbi:MAG: hypothetical protein IT368_13910 [Candidatus Hydrogenedentes bacterium]|nr:hypothetical protein [Candidatus Hydrogenedentota bacterium]
MTDSSGRSEPEFPQEADPRFTSGLPSHWRVDEEAFLRLGGYVEPRAVAAQPAPPIADRGEPLTSAPGSAEAFDRIIAELSREDKGTDDARDARDAMLNGAVDGAIAQDGMPGRADDPLAEAAQHEAQRRLRDANARLAEAEQVLRALESQPRDRAVDEFSSDEPRSIAGSILRFLLAVLLLLLLTGTIAGVAYATWYYYDEILALFPVN